MQPSSSARTTAPCTLTDLIAPDTHIPASASIWPESENLLRKGGVPGEDGNRGECNEVGEAKVGPSSLNMDPSPSRHIQTTGVTAMMIQPATMDLEHQGINLKPYKNLILQKFSMS